MYSKLLSYLIIIELLCFCNNTNAQNYNFNVKRYTIEDGLSHRAVKCILQSNDGFIWIGTEHGLNRFDGYNFKFWTKTDNNLISENITSIYEDSEKLLWLFTGIGDYTEVQIFDPITEKSISFFDKFRSKLPYQGIKLTSYYVTDNMGAIYIGTVYPSGVLKYYPKTGFEFIKTQDGYIFGPQIITGKKNLWGKLYKIGVVEHLAKIVEIDKHGIILNDLGKVYIKHPGNQYYSDKGSFYYEKQLNLEAPLETWYHSESELEKHLSEFDYFRAGYQPKPLWTFLEGNNLLAYENYIIDTKTHTKVLNLRNYIPELERSGVQYWIFDRTGQLWIACDFGICKVEIQENQFKNFLFNGNNEKLGKSIRAILPMEDGNIKVNTELFGQWNIVKKTAQTNQFTIAPNRFFYGMGIDKDKNLYYSVGANVLERLSPKGVKQEFHWEGGKAWCFYADNNQNLWIGTEGMGLGVFDLKSEKFIVYNKINGFNELSNTTIYYINKDKSDNIWVCAETGLYQLDPEKGIIGRYWSGGKNEFYLPYDYFLHFYIDNDNNFWLATSGGGLIKWNKSKGQVFRYGRKSGLPIETVYAVYEDRHKHLWMPSDFGIIQFDKEKGEVRRIYNTSNGISYTEFNRIAHARDNDGTLYFGGLNGITSFNPDLFYGSNSEQNAPLVIANCQKLQSSLGKIIDITKEVLKEHRVVLNVDEKYFTIELALLTYNETSKIQYAYKFEDEKNWHFQTDRTLRFGGLAFGKRNLQIKAQAANGDWSANELILEVNQLRPFYFQWWFIILFIASIFGFIKWRLWHLKKRQRQLEIVIVKATSHIKKQAEELRNLDIVKSRFFANVSHELRTPLTLILGPLGTLLKRKSANDPDHKLLKLAQQQSKGLLSLVNQILDLSKLESSKLEITETKVKLQSFILQVFGSFESHADRLGVNYYLNFHPDAGLVVLMDINKFETILNNLISNALKYTLRGESIIVEVENIQESIFISVTDTGSGIHPDDLPHIFERYYQSKQADVAAAGGTGIGLALCKELITLLKGKIWVESELGKGSKFFLKFPKKEIGDHLEIAENLNIKEEINVVSESNENLNVPILTLNYEANKALILVVEDNLNLREYLQMILSTNYQIVLMENGELAFNWLDKNALNIKPQLIISDIMMPVMDGFQLLTNIKNDERFMDIPVVMLTAKADANDKLKALRIGVDDYLLKPFDDEELLVRIKNLLSHYNTRQLYNERGVENVNSSLSNAGLKETENNFHSEHKIWLETLEIYIQEHLSKTELTTDQIAFHFSMSRSAFYRQVKRLTGLAPSQYLDEARFYKARQLLESRPGIQVKEVAYSVGFIKVKYFSQRFHQRFGKYPSDYIK